MTRAIPAEEKPILLAKRQHRYNGRKCRLSASFINECIEGFTPNSYSVKGDAKEKIKRMRKFFTNNNIKIHKKNNNNVDAGDDDDNDDDHDQNNNQQDLSKICVKIDRQKEELWQTLSN